MHSARAAVEPKARWDEEHSADETLTIISEFALTHALNGGTVGLDIATLIENRDYRALCDFELDYCTLNPAEASNCAQALAYFQKLEFLDIGYDRRKRARDKFFAAEQACRESNEFFRNLRLGVLQPLHGFDAVLHSARRKIARILGPVPTLEQLKLRFGSGATTLTKKRDASAREYLSAGLACSEGLLPYASRILEEVPGLSSLHATSESEETWSVPVQIMDAVADYVRKNARIDRVIIKEPPINVLMQLAVGDWMVPLLRRAGINIRDQSINQRLALHGSLTGAVATLDLSNASATICTELVYELLPFDWAYFLDVTRSKTVVIEGKVVQLEQFSSMGNGFTFPLETLIFWALASSAASDGFASVYGDDIVVSTGSVEAVINCLRLAGFTLNLDKSFWFGPFRESCGKDYHSGIDIRPVFCKKLLKPADLFVLHNFYARWDQTSMCERILKCIHPTLRIYGPPGYGDGHLHGDYVKIRKRKHSEDGYGGHVFDTFSYRPLRDKRYWRKGSHLLPVYSIYTSNRAELLASEVDKSGIHILRLERNGPISEAALPIPEEAFEVARGKYETHKVCSLPGYSGYRKTSIYIMG